MRPSVRADAHARIFYRGLMVNNIIVASPHMLTDCNWDRVVYNCNLHYWVLVRKLVGGRTKYMCPAKNSVVNMTLHKAHTPARQYGIRV